MNLSGTSRSDSRRDERDRPPEALLVEWDPFCYFSSRRLDIFSGRFGRPIRTNIHTYVNVIGPNYVLAQSHFFNSSAKQRRKGERRKEKGISGRCRPSAVGPSRKGGLIRGRRDFKADASLLIPYQSHQYFGSAVAVEALSRPPSPPISEEMFRLDPLILYPDENWTDDGKITIESMFPFRKNSDENQEGD